MEKPRYQTFILFHFNPLFFFFSKSITVSKALYHCTTCLFL